MSTVLELKKIAKELKLDALKAIYNAKSGHIGGCLSAAEVITYLYFYALNVNEQNPNMEDRDRFVLSKGHSAPILYAALARRGFFPLSDLERLRMVDSHLQGAPNTKTPGIDMSSGPLGQGLSAAVGMAINSRISNLKYNVWCMVGDGEIQEGQIWEAAMTAAKYKLSNLVCVLDYNKVQMSGTNDELMPVGDVCKKFEAFGWHVIRIKDGNNMEDVVDTLSNIWKGPKDKPIFVLSETVKGHGVSFMEGKAAWHGAVPTEEQYNQAVKELKEAE